MTDNTSTQDDRWRPLALSLVCLAVGARLLPHWPNFTPVGASGLFAGARMRGWRAFTVPLLAMVIGDPLLATIHGFRPFSRMTVFVYGSFLINVLIGRALRNTENPLHIVPVALLGSAQFFLITNIAVWLLGHPFQHDMAGLMACYVVALPFFATTAAGDLVYASALFVLHAWLSRRSFPRERVQREVVAA